MKFDLHDVELVGRDTPDPLRFAFQRKKSAHAGGMTRPITGDAIQSSLQKAHALVPSDIHAPRCLYIHIPFCRVRCTYCNFFQYASSKSLIDTYMEALREEIRWKAAEPGHKRHHFKQSTLVAVHLPISLQAISTI